MRRGDTVLVDTVAIIHAHETSCWNALTSAFDFETVEKCVEETQTGNLHRVPDDRIDEQALRRSLRAVHPVSGLERAKVAVLGGGSLDDGERDLWAHALAREDVWLLCGPDRASMRFGYNCNLRGRLVSLGAMLRTIDYRPRVRLDPHHEQAWLDEVIRKLMLGVL